MSADVQWTNEEARSVGVCLHGWLRRSCEACDLANRLEISEQRLSQVLTLARFAVNGWACYATRTIEHNEIHRLHQQLDEIAREHR